MTLKKLLLLALLLLPFGAWATAVARAQETLPGLTLSATAGFDGFYKSDQWLPITVHAANEGQSISGYYEVDVRYGTELVPFQHTIELPTQSRKRTTFLVPAGQRNILTVSLFDNDGRRLAQTVTPTAAPIGNAGARLIGVVSPTADLLSELARVSSTQYVIAYLDTNELPEDPNAWRSLDALVFADADSSALTAGQEEALETWLAAGGQLVVAGGPGWQKSTAAFADLLPVTPLELTSFEDLPGLDGAIAADFRDPGPYLITASTLRNGQAVLHEDGMPLLAARAHGRGSVVFIAFDPALPPFVDWDGAVAFWRLVEDQLPQRPSWGRGIVLPGSARASVSRVAALALPSAGSIFLFLLIYIAVIGPGNYLVLKRLGRRELAWITTPAIIFSFVVIAFLTGQRSLGQATIVNERTVIYGDLSAERLPADSVVALFAPRRGRYNLIAAPDTQLAPFSLLNRFDDRATIAAARYEDGLRLENIRADVGATIPFLGQHYRPPPELATTARLFTDSETGLTQLAVTIENRSAEQLEFVGLVLNDRYLNVPDIPAGDTLTWSGSVRLNSSPDGQWQLLRRSGASPPSTGMAELLSYGTPYNYREPEAYQRYQFAQAIIGDNPTLTAQQLSEVDAITLVAWSEATQLELALEGGRLAREGSTLYLLDIPVQNELTVGEADTAVTLIDPKATP